MNPLSGSREFMVMDASFKIKPEENVISQRNVPVPKVIAFRLTLPVLICPSIISMLRSSPYAAGLPSPALIYAVTCKLYFPTLRMTDAPGVVFFRVSLIGAPPPSGKNSSENSAKLLNVVLGKIVRPFTSEITSVNKPFPAGIEGSGGCGGLIGFWQEDKKRKVIARRKFIFFILLPQMQ